MKDFELPREPRFYELSEMEKIANSCVALEFSADINEPGKWQDKNGEWHIGRITENEEEE